MPSHFYLSPKGIRAINVKGPFFVQTNIVLRLLRFFLFSLFFGRVNSLETGTSCMQEMAVGLVVMADELGRNWTKKERCLC